MSSWYIFSFSAKFYAICVKPVRECLSGNKAQYNTRVWYSHRKFERMAESCTKYIILALARIAHSSFTNLLLCHNSRH